MLLGRIKELASDSLVYGASTLFTRFISIFLIPIYTRIFSPADYGVINLVNTTFLLIGIFIVAGLDNAAARWYWDNEDDKERGATFSSWFWFQLTAGVFVLALTAFSAEVLSTTIMGTSVWASLFLLAALNIPFTGINLVFTSWLRIKKKATATVAFSIVNSLLTVALSIIFVVFRHQGLQGVFLAQIVSNAACSVFALVMLARQVELSSFRVLRIKEMLRYSFPLVPAALAFWLLNSAGSYVINHYDTKTDVGLFQIGASVAGLCGMIFWAFLQAWSPFAMSIHKDAQAGRTYAAILDLYCAFGAFIVLAIVLFSPEILLLLTTKDYVNAASVATILTINVFIANIAQITSIGSALQKTNRPYVAGVFIGSAATLILFFILVPVFGREGAAISTLIGSSLLTGYVTFKSQQLFYVPYRLQRNIMIVTVLVIISFFAQFMSAENKLIQVGIKAIVLVLFGIGLSYLYRSHLQRGLTKVLVARGTRVREK